MHYTIDGSVVRTENAAKPATQASAHLTAWILGLPLYPRVLDYGCGKLRYAGVLAQRARSLTLVDSAIQITRIQTLGGVATSVRAFAPGAFPNCRVLTLEEFSRDRLRYDLILCANVLPIIPSAQARASLLRTLSSRLRPSGEALFVTQYRNSDFKKVASSPNASRHLDGWIVTTSRGSFYFGLLTKAKVARLITRYGFSVEKAWCVGQSAYVLAKAGA